MKTLKRSVAVLLSILMVFSVMCAGFTVTSAATNTTVYFVDSWNWGEVRCYSYNDYASDGTFPGNNMTLVDTVDGYDVYAYDVTVYTNVSFNNSTIYHKTDYFSAYDLHGKYFEPSTGKAYNTAKEALVAAGKIEAPKFASGSNLYLQPACWNSNGARFTAYFYNSAGDSVWTDLTRMNSDNATYSVKVPSGNWTNVIFCRMNGATGVNNWDNVWNQSADLSYDEVSNCYAITDWATGYWKTYEEKVVYFVNAIGWDNVYGFGWTDGIGSNTAWPGKAATLVDSEKGIYSFNPGDRKEVNFNNGDTYTSYFTCEDVYGQYIEAKTNSVYETAEEAWAAANAVKDEVYFTAGESLYFVPNSNWINNGNARFAAYLYNSKGDKTWLSMSEVDPDTDDYVCTIPSGNWSNVIFCRMNGANTTNNWDNVWNQTADLNCDGVSNCFTMDAISWTDGSWDTYVDTRCYFVNTLGWEKVGARNFIYSNYEQNETYDATLVDSKLGVYYYNPRFYGYLVFNDHDTNGERTVQVNTAGAQGKYLEPVTNMLYDTPEKAWTAAKAALATQPTTAKPTTEPTETTTATELSEFVGKKYYLVPNEWAIDGARFVAYFFKYGYAGVWVDMVDSNGDGIYEVTVPNGNYTQVIFYRMNGSTSENVEANAWNKSNQTYLDYGNCYTITLPWSNYDPGDWSTIKDSTPVATEPTETTKPATQPAMSVVLSGDWQSRGTEMTYSNGVYTTTLDIPTGSYGFKIFCNGTAYTNANSFTDSTTKLRFEAGIPNFCTLNASGGEYTFTFSMAECWLTVTYTPAVYLAGSFNDWSTTATPMEINGVTATTSVILGEGLYEFKIVENGTWYGRDNISLSNKSTAAGVGLYVNSGNVLLNASGGTYTFSYNFVSNNIVVTHSSGAEGSYKPGESKPNQKPNDSQILATEPKEENNAKCDHNYGKAIVTKKATCFAKGKKVYTCSDCGATKTVKTAKIKLNKPTVKVTAGNKKFSVKYIKVKGATGFEVKYSVKGKETIKAFATKKTANKAITKLSKSNYKVQVRAFATKGSKTAYSKWTKAKTVKVK